MRALELRAYDGAPESLALVERPVPQPAANEVLVRIAASPINPSDLLFLRDQHGMHKPLPAIPGYIGSGVVVDAGHNPLARMLVGRRVACAAIGPTVGMWAEYTLVASEHCIPLFPGVSTTNGATLALNPITAYGMLDEARRGRHRAIVQTAAASEVGRWVRRFGRHFGLPVINVVRREAQVAQLRAEGAEHVLNSSAPDFDAHLRELCHRLNATIVFDAVGGALTERLLLALPPRSRLLVYGALAAEPCHVAPISLIFDGLRVEGFYAMDWLASQNYLQRLRAIALIQRFAVEVPPSVRACFPLAETQSAIELYQREMGAGKVLIMPGLERVAHT
jgi:NADPH:quinone reductase-like Zn-dependent oxidoreductase